MLHKSNFSIEAAVANCSGAMEADTISKNARNPKSQMSRGMLFLVLFAIVAITGFAQKSKSLPGFDEIYKKYGPNNFEYIASADKNECHYVVKENGKYGVCDNYGKKIVPCQYDGVSHLGNLFVDKLQYMKVKNGNNVGVYNTKIQKEIVAPKYTDISIENAKSGAYYFHYFKVKKGDLYGACNQNGIEIFACIYESINDCEMKKNGENYDYSSFQVTLNGKEETIDVADYKKFQTVQTDNNSSNSNSSANSGGYAHWPSPPRMKSAEEIQRDVEQWSKSYDIQNGEATANLAKMSGNYTKALEDYEKHIEEYGSYTAMYELAEMYEYGLGVTRNTQTARNWYKKAENGGVTLGHMGVHGIDQNFYGEYTATELYEWAITLESRYAYQKYHMLRQAAFRGEKRAALTLAMEVDKDYGLKRDKNRTGDVAGWYYVAGMRQEANNLLNAATMRSMAETNRMTQQMIDNMNSSNSSSSRSSSNSSSGTCGLCNGTGQMIKSDGANYTGGSKWCDICKKTVDQGHYHTKCTSCGGTGRK